MVSKAGHKTSTLGWRIQRRLGAVFLIHGMQISLSLGLKSGTNLRSGIRHRFRVRFPAPYHRLYNELNKTVKIASSPGPDMSAGFRTSNWFRFLIKFSSFSYNPVPDSGPQTLHRRGKKSAYHVQENCTRTSLNSPIQKTLLAKSFWGYQTAFLCIAISACTMTVLPPPPS